MYDNAYCGINNNNKLVNVKKQRSRLTDTEGKLVPVGRGEGGGAAGGGELRHSNY